MKPETICESIITLLALLGLVATSNAWAKEAYPGTAFKAPVNYPLATMEPFNYQNDYTGELYASALTGSEETRSPTEVEEEPEYTKSTGKFTNAEALELAKKAQNPIANMRSFKFQNNNNFDIGPDDGTQSIVNVMPILPFQLSDDVLLISRTIIPVMTQPGVLTPEGEGRVAGLGDATLNLFLSPMNSDVTWGVGPSFLIPTATDEALGSDKWGAGISAILLDTPGRWVYGGIASNVWSTGGSGEQDINLFTLQYFINYNFDGGWYVMTSPIMTANWEADHDNRWTVPIGAGFGKLFKVGSQPMTAQVSAYKNVITPDDHGAGWQLRAMVMWMFPRK